MMLISVAAAAVAGWEAHHGANTCMAAWAGRAGSLALRTSFVRTYGSCVFAL